MHKEQVESVGRWRSVWGSRRGETGSAWGGRGVHTGQDCVDCVYGPVGGRVCQLQKTCASQRPTYQSLKRLGAPVPEASPTQLQSSELTRDLIG